MKNPLLCYEGKGKTEVWKTKESTFYPSTLQFIVKSTIKSTLSNMARCFCLGFLIGCFLNFPPNLASEVDFVFFKTETS